MPTEPETVSARIVLKVEGGNDPEGITLGTFKLDDRSISFEPGKLDAQLAELDTDSPVPGWANALAGLNVGDDKAIEDQVPADYRDPNLAGKMATYAVKVKSIKQRELPDVDDELARTVGEYEDLNALKADLRQRLEDQKKPAAGVKITTDGSKQ